MGTFQCQNSQANRFRIPVVISIILLITIPISLTGLAIYRKIIKIDSEE